MADDHGLKRWRDRWTRAGAPTIPLVEKRAICEAWQTRSPPDQWDEVGGTAFRGNIGVITGNGLAAIDCDDPRTTEAVTAGLANLGVKPDTLPRVRTASGDGCHIYVRIQNAPKGNYSLLAPEIGPGELRYGPSAYVVAPCSKVNGRRYRFDQNAPEAIPTLPAIQWRDLLWLITSTSRSSLDLEAPPIPLLRREMPYQARLLLIHLGNAPRAKPVKILDLKGKTVRWYRSRSEAEAAAMAMLILAGWDLENIKTAFEEHEPAHFTQHAKPLWYLTLTYRNALNALASTPTRLEIAESYQQAQRRPWPGQGGASDLRVYQALLAICWQWDTWEVRASQRNLAQHAAIRRKTTRRALETLQDAQLVKRAKRWHWDSQTEATYATAWQVSKCTSSTPEVTVIAYMGPATAGGSGEHTGGGAAESQSVGALDVNELWAGMRRGKSAGLVYERLGGDPRRVALLAQLTGKHRHTVTGALEVLADYGLAERVKGGWIQGPADLAEVAQELDAAGAAAKRRADHGREREAWREHLERVRAGDVPERQGTTNER